MAAKNLNNKDNNNLGFNVKVIKDICSKYKKYIATGAMLILLAVVISTSSASSNSDTPNKDGLVGTSVDDDGPEAEKLEEDAYPQVNELFEKYYGYYAAGDVDSIEKIAFPISDTEKKYIQMYSKFVDSYENIKCYTKSGIADGEYMVLVSADTKYKDVKTKSPGMTTFYVRKDQDGTAYIDNTYSEFNRTYKENLTNVEVNTLITDFDQDEDVKKLLKDVGEDFDKALEEDEDLNKMILSTLRSAIADWVATFEAEGGKAPESEENDGKEPSGDDNKETEARTAYVKSDGVNLRKKRSTSSDVLLSLDKGTKVTVYGESKDGWYKVKCKGKTGFVSKDYIVSEDPNKKAETDKKDDGQTDNKTVKTRTAYIKTDGVNLRKKRSTSSDVLMSLDAGTKVTVYGEGKDGWYKVKCKGKTGFVSEDYVVSDKSKVEKPDPSKTKRIAYAKEGVNMRKSRSTDSEVIQTLKAGTKVMIYGKSKNGWFRVRSKGKFGYVKKEYIVSDKSKVKKDGDAGQNTASSPSYFNEGDRITLSDSVNVRQSMSESADRVGLAYKGDVLTVIMSYAEGWTKVSWNGQTGFVKTEYLR